MFLYVAYLILNVLLFTDETKIGTHRTITPTTKKAENKYDSREQ